VSGGRQSSGYYKNKAYYIEYKKVEDNEFITITGSGISDDKSIEIIDTFKFID